MSIINNHLHTQPILSFTQCSTITLSAVTHFNVKLTIMMAYLSLEINLALLQSKTQIFTVIKCQFINICIIYLLGIPI